MKSPGLPQPWLCCVHSASEKSRCGGVMRTSALVAISPLAGCTTWPQSPFHELGNRIVADLKKALPSSAPFKYCDASVSEIWNTKTQKL